ncbi:DedA family protein [Vreelandella boliviensis]|uniref:DedA family protein n=1 Tax=Vreelandella boliviensis TaxID=223527 RepID=UPI001B8ACE9C|nr:DedA family protein [Halomonas boliviensis]MBS3666318.1 DedA family protein [Halomonas boliviensis]
MTFEHLVADYGSFGLFLGASLEGEAIAMLGGIIAHQHLVGFWSAVGSLALGSFLADQVFFLLGHWWRNSAYVRSIHNSVAGGHVLTTFNAHPNVFVFSFRFIYGLRIASAVTIGTTDFPWPRFILLNAVSALVWATVWVTLGYVFGKTIEALFARLSNLPHFALVSVAVGICVAILAVIAAKKRRGQRLNTGD